MDDINYQDLRSFDTQIDLKDPILNPTLSTPDPINAIYVKAGFWSDSDVQVYAITKAGHRYFHKETFTKVTDARRAGGRVRQHLRGSISCLSDLKALIQKATAVTKIGHVYTGPIFIPTIGQEMTLTKPWSFRVIEEHRNVAFLTSRGLTVSGRYGQSVASHGIVLPAGAVLRMDRIYIRKGAPDFDSVSFVLCSAPGFKKSRFWVRLEDANKIVAAVSYL